MIQTTATTAAGLLMFLISCRQVSDPSMEPVESPSVAVPKGRFVAGGVTNDVVEEIRQWRPLTDHLAAQLNEFGIGRGEVRVASELETMSAWLRQGEVDLYIESYYPATRVARSAGVKPSLLRSKYPAEKSAMFLARKDSGLTSVSGLKGKVIALEERSTTSFMLPIAHLRRTGLRPVAKAAPDAPTAADEIGYIFVRDDIDAIQWVLSRRVVAAVVDNLHFAALPPSTTRELVVLGESEAVLRHQLVLLRPNMDPELRAAVRRELVGLGETEGGRTVLKHLESPGFVEISHEQEKRLRRAGELFSMVEE